MAKDAKHTEIPGTVSHSEEFSHQSCHVEKLKEIEKESFLRFGGREQTMQCMEARIGKVTSVEGCRTRIILSAREDKAGGCTEVTRRVRC